MRFFTLGIKILASVVMTKWSQILLKTFGNVSCYANISFASKKYESHLLVQVEEKWWNFLRWRNFFCGYCRYRVGVNFQVYQFKSRNG